MRVVLMFAGSVLIYSATVEANRSLADCHSSDQQKVAKMSRTLSLR
jgi:hypothetical protein